MNVVLKEWLKDKKACGMMLIWFITEIIYTIIDTRLILLISNALSDVEHLKDHLIIIGGASVLLIALSMIDGFMLPTAKMHCFTSINDRWEDKMIDADFEMFTKYSCSHIWTVGGFMWNITTIGIALARMILNGFTIVVLLWNMYLIGGSMIIPVIIVYAIAGVIFKVIFNKLEKIDKDNHENMKKRNQEAENIINGFAEVRSFDTLERHRSSIHNINKLIYDKKLEKSKIHVTLHGSIEIVEKIGMGIVIIYAAKQLMIGEITQAAAMSLIMYVIRLINPLLNILDFVDEVSELLSQKDDYNKIITYVNRYDDNGDIKLSEFQKEIVLKGVSFSYDDTKNAVNNINMKIKKGQRIGICGVSGGGKSTLFKLINKFYKPTSGSITIDGCDIWNISNHSYRKHIGSVHQENMIFPGSIKYNVMYGSEYSTDSEVIEACKKAKIYDFICSLDKKFDTEVGPRGLKLSGGQKQRIALARLFLRNPDIILLDEATSALDNESETFVQEAINELKGKTIITIAHRLSTIRDCDEIYVIGNEGVIEHGTHDSLIKLDGAYKQMLK